MTAIPADEHEFHSKFAGSRADALAKLHRVEDILAIDQSQSFKCIVKISKSGIRNFPFPRELWVNGKYDWFST